MTWCDLSELLEKWKNGDDKVSASDIACAIDDLIDAKIREHEDGSDYD